MIRLLLLSLLLAEPAAAEWTFKSRVPPLASQSGGRIDIGIRPAAPLLDGGPRAGLLGGSVRPLGSPRPPRIAEPDVGPAAPPAQMAAHAPRAATGAADWFWRAVPPGAAVPSDRLRLARRALTGRPAGFHAPAPRTVARIVRDHGPLIERTAARHRVSPALVVALIAAESAGRVDARSHADAHGLMQLIPATAARFGVRDPYDPAQNVAGGVAYLDWLLDHFGGDAILALAGYNAGEGAVARNGGVPPYRETRAYVPKVLAAWDHARRLCARSPEGASTGPRDPCALRAPASGVGLQAGRGS